MSDQLQQMVQRAQEREVGTPAVCGNCGLPGATERWYSTGGALAVSHGMFSLWCRRCILAAQLDYALAQAERIPGLREELAALDPKPAGTGSRKAPSKEERQSGDR